MGKIAKMNPHLANMIAAGEVVEKPASVVKELVENALDANATTIKIFLQEGGLKEIKIIDDGEGMDEEDVKMAFLPHATSKIKTEYDLFRILSLGFRGEAIASIAAVSKMQIVSGTDGIGGYQVTVEAGVKQSDGPIASNRGTTVTVQNLFFNTPARLKYLKPAKNEFAAISYLLDRLALSYPAVRFELYNDQKRCLVTSSSNRMDRLMGEIYGLDVAKNLLIKEYVSDGYEAKLVLVKPSIYRSNKLEMTFFVNGRFVKNQAMTKAVLQGYDTMLPIGKYPICVLYFTIDPLLVDVNVHPSKMQIKLSNEEKICLRLTKEIRQMLESSSLVFDRTVEVEKAYVQPSIFNFPTANEQPQPYRGMASSEQRVDLSEQKETISLDFVPKEPPLSPAFFPELDYVGQAFGTYLIFQNKEGLVLMDQHAAAERINYEKVLTLLCDSSQPVSELLVPLVVSFTKSEALEVENHLAQFQSAGFVLEPLSKQDFTIRALPLWAKVDQAEGLVHDLLLMFLENRQFEVRFFRDAIAKQIACKGSIKANHALSRAEIEALIEQLKRCDNPFTCPHGRPTMIRLSPTELEKMFERIQK